MPRFYTHLLKGSVYAQDPEGEEFANSEAACQSARRGARSLVINEIAARREPVKLEYYIHDDTGTLLATCTVSAVVSGLN